MAGSTQSVLSQSAWTDLGAAPVMVQTVVGPVMIAVADEAPDVGTKHFQLGRDTPNWPQIFYPADADSHVFAIGLGGPASVVSSPWSAT